MSNNTFAGFSSDPRYIVPTYPAPSSFYNSTLNPDEEKDGLSFQSEISSLNSSFLTSYFLSYWLTVLTISAIEIDFPGSKNELLSILCKNLLLSKVVVYILKELSSLNFSYMKFESSSSCAFANCSLFTGDLFIKPTLSFFFLF